MKVAFVVVGLLVCCAELLARGGALTPDISEKTKNNQMHFPKVFWNFVQQQNYVELHQLLSHYKASQADFTIIRQSLLKREEHTEQA